MFVPFLLNNYSTEKSFILALLILVNIKLIEKKISIVFKLFENSDHFRHFRGKNGLTALMKW